MPEIAVNPLLLQECDLLFGLDDFAAAASSVMFTPTSGQVVFKGLKKSSVHTATTTATWACAITYAQDWQTPGSLSRYLYTNEGNEVEVEFKPKDGGPSFTALITITPGAIGGAVDTHGTATVTLGCKGRPELVEAGA